MVVVMTKFSTISKIMAIAIVFMAFAMYPIFAISKVQETSDTEVLQYYLNIHEVEKEIERVTVEQARIQEELKGIEDRIINTQLLIDEYKKRAANIARAYYMGDRYDLLILLFTTNDLQQFIRLYDTVSYLFENDQEDLLLFHQEIQQLHTLFLEKEKQMNELDNLGKHLIAQRSVLEQFDRELGQLLQGVSDIERIERLKQQLISDWEEKGIPAFHLFLQAISHSMSGMATKMTDHVSFSLTSATLTISDHEFTSLLQQENELFRDFQITFDKGRITFFGTYRDLVLTMTGSYELESNDFVRFQVEELKYNGFQLPTSTAKDLEARYDLGIYPKQIHERLIIKEVNIDDGMLKISFSLSLK